MPQPPSNGPSASSVLRFADLSTRKPTRFEIVPEPATLSALAADLELSDLRKLRLAGALHPEGKADWRLEATLGATVVQPCSVTLTPVTTRIEEPVLRRYLADWTDPDGSEVEMPEDETAGPVPATLDLAALLAEELALAIPLYPRAEGVALGAAVFTEPGKPAMTDDDAKPFAALQQLRAGRKPDGG
ncbi:YceD family protein [Dinoroseobacter sp. PD6]|uniref:YceD family protein n=1 Tax=Dinoroseobacter sp. PD6 TaxID=3028384 RepID=UPI00237AF0E6|nr:YceD family protein [Dinoroseobacter sp. PD6]MDD9715446.1 YceD family protein [Dinoroseobacter sp. PD6]